ncbi:MAG: YitT family protein [Bacteroidetes bacterium]|uniref:YitT family protein n=1 Tax=Candidatus Cryptobacteroides intestinigallinarum TaxID=2840767 RepID=A0A9D9MZK5_9BACT|nr:YitT family protein [Candidatus Cryptobacteroides intestinigallinarum]
MKNLFSILKEYAILTFGTVIYVLAWTSFMIPNGIASGGGTGLCTIVYFATDGAIPVSVSFFVLNAILLIIGFLVMGKGFGFKTIYIIILSTVLFDVFPRLGWDVVFDEKFLVAVVGGTLEAVGIGIVLMKGGSTGGTDIVAMVVNKYWPVSPGKVYLYSDLFIIASILLVPGKTLEDMIYGYVVMITFSFMVDFVLLGQKSSVQVLIFSSKYKEIADSILKMDRGVTALKSMGWYSKNDSNVLLVIVRRYELHKVVSIIKDIDRSAFVSVSSASDVYGEGFDEMKTGIDRKKKIGDKE